MRILYFAWLRAKVGLGEEVVSPPDHIRDVSALISWLKGRSDGLAQAFADPSRVRVAVNQTHVGLDHPVGAGDEVAFFPPVTGG